MIFFNFFFLTAVSVDLDRGTAIKWRTETNSVVTEGGKTHTMVKKGTFQLMIKSLKRAADTNHWHEQRGSTFNWMDPEFVKGRVLACQDCIGKRGQNTGISVRDCRSVFSFT